MSDDGFFPRGGPGKRTRELPPNRLGDADLTIERGNEDACRSTLCDSLPKTGVFGMDVQRIGHEAGRERNNAWLLLVFRQ